VKAVVVACGQGKGLVSCKAVSTALVMVWPRGAKQGYVLVQQSECEEHLADVISPLTDMSNIRQLVSELSQTLCYATAAFPALRCYASCIM
jgi:hypothetical protein